MLLESTSGASIKVLLSCCQEAFTAQNHRPGAALQPLHSMLMLLPATPPARPLCLMATLHPATPPARLLCLMTMLHPATPPGAMMGLSELVSNELAHDEVSFPSLLRKPAFCKFCLTAISLDPRVGRGLVFSAAHVCIVGQLHCVVLRVSGDGGGEVQAPSLCSCPRLTSP